MDTPDVFKSMLLMLMLRLAYRYMFKLTKFVLPRLQPAMSDPSWPYTKFLRSISQ